MDTNIQIELYREFLANEIRNGNEDNLPTFSEWRELNKEVLS